MKASWKDEMVVDPRPAMLELGDEALTYFVRRDLIEQPVPPVETLWGLPEAARLTHIQLPDGSWKYPGKKVNEDAGQNYNLLETFRNLRILVEIYAFTREHPTLRGAAEYVFGCQSDEGDIRGILGNQYMPYYHGALLELLIKAGYGDDPRVARGLDWLLDMRQADGGWIVPAQAVPSRERDAAFWRGAPLLPERSLPHAHLATGMALRGLAAHPHYRHRPETIAAGKALKSRLLQADKYNDRRAKSYWLKFQFPFWWTSLVSALDTLSWLPFGRGDRDIEQGLAWFRDGQEADGLWPTGYGCGRKARSNQCWVGLAVCRALKRDFAE
jgi:hypothetical protein